MRHDKDDPRLATMQGRLNYLFDNIHPAGKSRYTLREASEIIKRDQEFDLSPAYINQLCNGKKDNPGVQQVRALAKFFGVPAGWLLDGEDLDKIVEQVEILKALVAKAERHQALEEAMSDPHVRNAALMMRGMSTSHRILAAALLDQISRHQDPGQQATIPD